MEIRSCTIASRMATAVDQDRGSHHNGKANEVKHSWGTTDDQ